MRILAWSVLGLLGLVVVLVLGALVALRTEAGRDRACPLLAGLVNRSIHGTLRIGRCEVLSPGHLRFENLGVDDPAGRRVLSVRVLSVRPDVWALVRGVLRVREVRIVDPVAHLSRHGDRFDLAAALEPRSVAREVEAATDTPLVVVGVLRVSGGRADALPEGLVIEHLRWESRLVHDRTLILRVRSLSADLRRKGEVVARLVRASGVVRTAAGARSTVQARVTSGADSLELSASALGAASGPRAIQASAIFSLSPALLRQLGAKDLARGLRAPLRGIVAAQGSLADFRAQAALVTAGGDVQLWGRSTGGPVQVGLATSGLELGQVLTGIAHARVAGSLSATVSAPARSSDERAVDLTLQNFRFDDLVIPSLSARGSLGADHVSLTSMDVPHLTGLDGHLDVVARIGFDGSVDGRLDARFPEMSVDPNLRRLSPRTRGGVEAALQVRVSAGARRIDLDGRVAVRAASLRGVRISRLDVAGWVRGPPRAPSLSLRIAGQGLQGRTPGGAAMAVRRIDLTLEGGPRRYDLAGCLRLARRRSVEVAFAVIARGDTYQIDGTSDAHGLWSAPLHLAVTGVRVDPARSVELGALRLTGGGLLATAHGTVRFAGPSSVQAQVRGLQLADLDRALSLRQGLAGMVELDVGAQGTLRAPDLTLRARLTSGTVARVPVQSAALEAQLDGRARTLVASSHARLGRAGSVDAHLAGRLGPSRDLVQAVRGGSWDGRLEAHALSAALVALFVPQAPALEGKVEVRLLAQGTLEVPRVRLEVSGRELSIQGRAPMALDVALDVVRDHLALTVGAADARGRLLALELRSAATLAMLVPPSEPAALLKLPWELRLTVPGRRLDAFPAPARIDLPVRLSGGAVLRGGPGPLQADVHLELVSEPPSVVAPGCRAGPAPRLGVEIVLRDGQTRISARGALQGTDFLEAEASAATPVQQWLTSGLPSLLPPVQGSVRVVALALDSVPLVCARATGTADLTLRAKDLFTTRASLEIVGAVRRLRVGTAPLVDLALRGALTGAYATLTAKMFVGPRGAFSLDARLPVLWSGGALVPSIRAEPWRARMVLDRAPIAPLLSVVPDLEQPAGVLDGAIDVRGVGSEVRVAGAVRMDGVSFILTDPLLRVDDAQGRIGFAPDGITLEDVSMQDGTGRLQLGGRLGLQGLSLRSLDLRLRARDYPARVDGVVFAYVDTFATLAATLSRTRRTARLSLRSLAVRLPEQRYRMVQALAQDPDVVYEDQPGFASDRELTASRAAGPVVHTVQEVPLDVEVDASRPFWVRRSDFGLQLTSRLEVSRQGGQTRIAGVIRVRRGFLQLLGKTFAFQPGELRFDTPRGGVLPPGGADVNPLLDLQAVHTLASGETVTVRIGGRLKQPALTFATSVAGVTTEREILDLLVRGRGGPASQSVRDQAFSMLSGLTAGLLSALTRRELGAFLPVLAIDSTGVGGTRLRAGLETDRLIPRFLRGLVHGAYVEGFLGTGGLEGNGARSSSGGFLVEFYLPRDLVTSGTFAEPSNWSVDLSWQP